MRHSLAFLFVYDRTLLFESWEVTYFPKCFIYLWQNYSYLFKNAHTSPCRKNSLIWSHFQDNKSIFISTLPFSPIKDITSSIFTYATLRWYIFCLCSTTISLWFYLAIAVFRDLFRDVIWHLSVASATELILLDSQS